MRPLPGRRWHRVRSRAGRAAPGRNPRSRKPLGPPPRRGRSGQRRGGSMRPGSRIGGRRAVPSALGRAVNVWTITPDRDFQPHCSPRSAQSPSPLACGVWVHRRVSHRRDARRVPTSAHRGEHAESSLGGGPPAPDSRNPRDLIPKGGDEGPAHNSICATAGCITGRCASRGLARGGHPTRLWLSRPAFLVGHQREIHAMCSLESRDRGCQCFVGGRGAGEFRDQRQQLDQAQRVQIK